MPPRGLVGLQPALQGFGGEEGYIHEKFRQAGRRTLCLPWMRWTHRFGRPKGPTYRNTHEDRLHNYLVGHSELGMDVTPIVEHFSEVLPEEVIQRVITQAFWPAAVEPALEPTLGDVYDSAVAAPSDINEHLPKLLELAEQCEHVTEFGTRSGVSTTALAAGKPRLLKTYDVVRDGSIDRLVTLAAIEGVELHAITADVLAIEIEETDLLFIDTKHTAAQLYAELRRHAAQVRRWIALHDTETFGERGEDGGPGLLSALDRFLREQPEWTVTDHSTINNGFTVISRGPAHPMKALPEDQGRASWPMTATAPRMEAATTRADGSDLPFLVAICPTYNRRRLVENAIACFLAQDYPPHRRQLLVLDDFGDLGSVERDTWSVVSQQTRLPTLPSKYSALAELACTRWPDLDALVIWEDDDVYLPRHLLSHGQALRSGRWSKPATVLSTHGGTVHEEPSAGRFFASIAFRLELFRAADGFVETARGDFDQQFLSRLQSFGGPPVDTTSDAAPTYVFRWQETGAVHGEQFMTGADDETWYGRAGAAVPAPVLQGVPVPRLDVSARELMDLERRSSGGDRASTDPIAGPTRRE